MFLILKQSIKSEGVINLFSDIKEEFSLFDPKFLQEVANMKEKNLAVELLKKLIAEQVSVYRRTNVVKSEKFSEIMQRSLNAYLNGMLTNEEVIEEMLKLAKQIAAAQKEGDQLGLTADELLLMLRTLIPRTPEMYQECCYTLRPMKSCCQTTATKWAVMQYR